MTHLWLRGSPIRVRADALGAPRSFTWQGHYHVVTRITRRWRADEQWWRGRVWREYFKLATRDRLLVEIFHDLLGGGWYVQRRYD